MRVVTATSMIDRLSMIDDQRRLGQRVGNRWNRWFRHEPIDPPAGSGRSYVISNTGVDVATARLNRGNELGPGERWYSITTSIGGFQGVGIGWSGTSEDDVRNSFLEFLNNDNEFGVPHHPKYRSLHVKFNGKRMQLTFRRDWVAGFAVG